MFGEYFKDCTAIFYMTMKPASCKWFFYKVIFVKTSVFLIGILLFGKKSF